MMMRPTLVTALKQLLAASAVVLCLEVAGWGNCVGPTAYTPQPVNNTDPPLSCNGVTCQHLSLGGCSDPREGHTYLCIPSNCTVSYEQCTVTNNGCSAVTASPTVACGYESSCP